MVHHPDAVYICYGVCHLENTMAVQGFIYFGEMKDMTMVQVLLPNMNVTALESEYDSNTIYNFIKLNALYVKTWWLPSDPNDESDMMLQVEWHHMDPSTNEHTVNTLG